MLYLRFTLSPDRSGAARDLGFRRYRLSTDGSLRSGP